MARFEFLENIWYRRLVDTEEKDGLLSRYTLDDLKDKLTVAVSTPTIVSKGTISGEKAYSVYDLPDFAHQYIFVPENNRWFYEVIFGGNKQKPHFDIDIDLTDINLKELNDADLISSLIDSIKEEFEKQNIELNLEKDVLLFTSHGKTKKSYHVVIDNYCHSNNMQSRYFYNAVLSRLPVTYRDVIDPAVYSNKQLFRLVYSQKVNSGRPKVPLQTWQYHTHLIKYQLPYKPSTRLTRMIIELSVSLVSKTNRCKDLKPIDIAIEPRIIEGEKIEDEDATAALELLAKTANVDVNDPMFPYKIDTVIGNMVVLRRIKPSVCRLCMRTHSSQNPYLLIVGSSKIVYFACRRSKDEMSRDRFLEVGQLKPDISQRWIESILGKDVVCPNNESQVDQSLDKNILSNINDLIDKVELK